MIIESDSELAARAETLAKAGHLATALDSIREFVLRIIQDQFSHGRVFSSQTLDLHCLKLGNLGGSEDIKEDRQGLVFIATEIAPTGGHTRIIMDIALAHDERPRNILLSNVANQPISADLTNQFQALGFNLQTAPNGNAAEKLRWMQDRLTNLMPVRTYMLIHPFDAVSVATVQKRLCGELYYIHNNDHALALGVHIPHAVHVDFHMKGYSQCRLGEGVRLNQLWPVVATDKGSLGAPALDRGHLLTTCTCGGFEKFSSVHLRRSKPYRYPYEQMIPKILMTTGGLHIHIGHLHNETLVQISDGMAQAGLPKDRFRWISSVPDLWEALLELKPNLYIGSFPIGGGRATVEAMGAGLPLLIYDNYRSMFLSVVNEIYEGAMVWRTEAELLGHLRNLNLPTLLKQAQMSRAFYEEHHEPELLRDAVKGINTMPQPVEKTDRSDRLQLFLDETTSAKAPSGLEHTANHALSLAEEAHIEMRRTNEKVSEAVNEFRDLRITIDAIANSLKSHDRLSGTVKKSRLIHASKKF